MSADQPLSDDHDYSDDHDTNLPDETTSSIASWGVSILTHVLVLLVLAAVVIATQTEKDRKPVRTATIAPTPEQPKPPEDPKPLEQPKVEIPEVTETDVPVIDDLDLPENEIVTTEDPVPSEVEQAKGRQDALSNSEMGANAFIAAIGPGGSAPGQVGFSDVGARRRSAPRRGATRGSENAVERALRWFRRHQSPNGQWDVDGYPVNCDLGPRCEPGGAVTDISGDMAVTGYAVMAFLGAGYDHKTPNQFRSTVRRGLEWIVENQGPDGQLGRRNYEQGIAAMALAEAYGMTLDPWLREPAQRAMDFIIAHQAQDADGYGLAWDYTAPKRTRNDSSVSGWNVMALKAGSSAGLNIGNGIDGSRRWLEGAWQAANPNHASLDVYGQSQFPYTWNADTDAVKMHNGDLTCVGGLVAVFTGSTAGEPMLETMGNWLFENQLPTAWPTDTYFLYYNTLTMFQLGDHRWDAWNNTVRDLLVDNQRTDGDASCFDGSWDPAGAGAHKVADVGRTLVTAYAVLSLEVYYRKARIMAR